MGCHPLRGAAVGKSMPVPAFITALANATPDEQRKMLGESLYMLVDQLEPNNVVKVTGMLLETDKTEVLHLLESPGALKAKVEEAMEELRNAAQQASRPVNQLAALSLNDNPMS